jgi:preprotein translocase subunit SecG
MIASIPSFQSALTLKGKLKEIIIIIIVIIIIIIIVIISCRNSKEISVVLNDRKCFRLAGNHQILNKHSAACC